MMYLVNTKKNKMGLVHYLEGHQLS